MTERKMLKNPYPLGAHSEAEEIRFSFVSESDDCGVILYDIATGKELSRYQFTQDERIGNVYCKYISGIKKEEISYQFYEGEEILEDRRAKAFSGKAVYGISRQEDTLKAVFPTATYDWEEDTNPCIPYEDCIIYCLHVRGFTKHTSSGVSHKGTFAGLTEKIDYLKETGITTVELQPAYEFMEFPTDKEMGPEINSMAAIADNIAENEKKLNYWGYKRGYYYTPKSAYAAGKDAAKEFKQMVKAFHKQGMEVVMQFYFTKDVPLMEIPEILRHWVLEYHVDGFHIVGDNVPMELIVQDAMLSRTKLWYNHFNIDAVYDKKQNPSYCNLAEYQDDYLYTMRKFLKGDEGMLKDVLFHMRHIPEKCGRIHYLSNYNTFTLKDMVSYEYKHNEENGENNRDGNSYNCSWNCGEEGATRKKKVIELRRRQMKNAISLLLLSQSTPLIFMGDEFGNSQQGNNNPYCQDNKITWLDWKDLERNRDIYQFWKELIKLRKEHPILHTGREFRIMDYAACGYPDISYHGESAWRAELETHFRHVGIMYCGKYAKCNHTEDDDFFYIAMNMHWEPHELALPKLPKGMIWKVELSTSEEQTDTENSDTLQPVISPRSITLYRSMAVKESVKADNKKSSRKAKK